MRAALAPPNPGRWLRCGAAWLLAAAAWWQPALAADAPPADCPPAAAAPTPAQLREAAAQARDRGFLWRIERDGHAGYLYGTVHIGKLAWIAPGPQVRAALLASDTLALELDVSDPQLGAQVAAALAPAGGHTIQLPAALHARLQRLAAAACVAPEQLQGQHPVMQALALTLLAARRDGLDPAYGQEFVLAGTMAAMRRPVVSLETPEVQLAALVPPEPGESLRLVEQMVEQLEQDRARGAVLRLAEVWEQGDLARLDRYEQWCECVHTDEDRRQLQRLNDARNPALAARIDELHRQGRKLFVAVGALHMTGPQGLPRLLAEQGFHVKRLLPLR